MEKLELERKKLEYDHSLNEQVIEKERASAELDAQVKKEVSREKSKAKSPKLPPFEENKDELDSYLARFERYALAQGWCKDD